MSHLHATRVLACAVILLAAGQWSVAQKPDVRGHETAHLGTTKEVTKDGSNNKGKIEGTKWSSIEFTTKGNTIPAGSIKFEFTKDGKMTYKILDKPYTGRYTLGEGDKVTLDLDEELAGSKKHVQTIVIKGDTLRLIDTDGTELKFEKTK